MEEGFDAHGHCQEVMLPAGSAGVSRRLPVIVLGTLWTAGYPVNCSGYRCLFSLRSAFNHKHTKQTG